MYEDDEPHLQGVARIESFAHLQKLTVIYAKSNLNPKLVNAKLKTVAS